jgi:hypothetical protein
VSSAIAEKVSRVPEAYAGGEKSTAMLLREAGFPKAQAQLKVDDLEEALREKPMLVDLWMRRAKDQRLVGGWGLEKCDGEYRVTGYAQQGLIVVRDRTRAIAEFIARYVAFMNDVLARQRR